MQGSASAGKFFDRIRMIMCLQPIVTVCLQQEWERLRLKWPKFKTEIENHFEQQSTKN